MNNERYKKHIKLSRIISDSFKNVLQDNDIASLSFRRSQIKSLWEEIVGEVFKNSQDFILSHTNAIYIVTPDKSDSFKRFDRPLPSEKNIDGNVLIIYSDDSIMRSELDNRQEIIKMKCKEKGENIEALRIIPSKNNMKNRHPFQEKLEEKKNVEEQLYKEKIKKLNQSSFQLEQGFTKAFRNVSKVENEEIRESLKKAIKAQYDEKNN